GVLGRDFFNVPQSGQLILGNTGNAGQGKLALVFDNYSDLTATDYRLTLTASNTVRLTRLSDNLTWSGSGNNQAEAMASLMDQVRADGPQGFSLSMSGSGSMTVGDTFLIRPTRYGARDISMALTDPRSIALATPISTTTTVSNAGTAKISAGVVSDTAVSQVAPFNLTYELSSDSLIGFPVGAMVDAGGISYRIDSPDKRIPYVSGSNISLNGTSLMITGVPEDGDTFTVPPPLFTPVFGVPTTDVTTGVALGGAVPTTPLTVTAGLNDKFDISINGDTATTITLTPGVYKTPGAIAAQMQSDVNAAMGAGRVTVTLAQNNLIQAASTTSGDSLSLSPYAYQTAVDLTATPVGSVRLADNAGSGEVTAGIVSRKNSLPAAPITLKYLQQSSNPDLPARLSGLPVGTVVTVTPTSGAATSYTILRPTDYIAYSSEATIAFNGISFSISGEPIDGDTFSITSNPSGVSDNRNALLLGSLQTLNTIAGGTASYQSAYSQLVSQVGNKAREVEVASSAQETLVKQGKDVIQSMSGVNLDEEAANLIRYQQAYQASAKMIDVASKLFAEVLALGK
ncbi:MAG: hypothetical protein NTX56_10870, partial [Proteobacteria bacterium]|nr:hypothetical protein [Pseudomonadota bacterium]